MSLTAIVKVSFGTYFWPPKQEYVEELVTAFIEKGVPFVSEFTFCYYSTLISLSDIGS